MKDGLTSSIDFSKGCISFRLTFAGVNRLMTIIRNKTIQKVINILSRKGKTGKIPPVQSGKNFRVADKGIVSMVPNKAAPEVVFFQNKPKRKIANTPGERKPTYSCINWYA